MNSLRRAILFAILCLLARPASLFANEIDYVVELPASGNYSPDDFPSCADGSTARELLSRPETAAVIDKIAPGAGAVVSIAGNFVRTISEQGGALSEFIVRNTGGAKSACAVVLVMLPNNSLPHHVKIHDRKGGVCLDFSTTDAKGAFRDDIIVNRQRCGDWTGYANIFIERRNGNAFLGFTVANWSHDTPATMRATALY